jgi:hypothetical protein
MTSLLAVPQRETLELMTQFGEKWFSREHKHDPSVEVHLEIRKISDHKPGGNRPVCLGSVGSGRTLRRDCPRSQPPSLGF